ncbi:TonB family protein, partial [Chitinophaga sp.]|uniref:TonB family protein n=1 Tax=Chitinophaga sp. TaxID=1869181 RepID=UPI002F91D085
LTSNDDLADMKKVLAEKGITVNVPTLKRNATGEIISIRFVAKDTKGGTVGETLDQGPINPFFFYFGEKESGIGEIAGKNFPRSLIDLALAENNGSVKGVTSDTAFLNRFPGGQEAYAKIFAKYTRYPRVCQENGKMGNVRIQYKIQPSGAITDVEVLSAPDKALGDEVKRVVGLLPAFAADPNSKTVTVSLCAGFRLKGLIEPKWPATESPDVIIIGYGTK